MKEKNVFICRDCGYESQKWFGKCPGCSEWNTMDEQLIKAPSKATKGATRAIHPADAAVPIDSIESFGEARISTGLGELDTVLGGGLVPGSLVLVGGDPGIGKSTLMLQICGPLSREKQVLYLSGEESVRQIKMRADRLGVNSSNVKVAARTNIVEVMETIATTSTEIVIVDSIQTMYHPELSSAPGSVSQVRECAMQLLQLAKNTGVTVFLVGHVTKEGAIAGPRVLEHMVDCVLYFEGERHLTYRILRAVKNRFGSTNEIGVFEMTGEGLMEVLNPSMMLLSGRPSGVSGSCVACPMEGTRPILAEVQTLITPTAFGTPRRMCTGFEYNRAAMIIAVLEKRCNMLFGNKDVYVNVTGGLRLDDPAADMALALSLASSYLDKPLDGDFIAMGEIGLAGEIRNIPHAEKRVQEGVKLGFTKMLAPPSSIGKGFSVTGAELYKPNNIAGAIALLL